MDPQQYQPAPVPPTPAFNPTPAPTPAPTPTVPVERNILNGRNHKKVGPIVAALVVILLLVIGALYVLATKVNKQAIPIDNTTNGAVTLDTTINSDATSNQTAPEVVQPVTGTADDVNSLQADLNASLKGLDAQSI